MLVYVPVSNLKNVWFQLNHRHLLCLAGVNNRWLLSSGYKYRNQTKTVNNEHVEQLVEPPLSQLIQPVKRYNKCVSKVDRILTDKC